MKITIGDFEYSEVWDGVFYKKLSKYPQISDWELRNIIEFMNYEKMQGRACNIECENPELLADIQKRMMEKEQLLQVERPKRITECTACPVRRGCETKFVCHTTSLENAISILKCGSLLSAVKARQKSAEELSREDRNAAKDPQDYFEYIMFTWGNCQAGDRLVMERNLGRFPNEKDLSLHFIPGIRFYFLYDNLKNHPGCTFDGVLPFKIKDELVLSEWLFAMVIPEVYKEKIHPSIPDDLKNRVIYVQNDCKDIWEWSEKVYTIIENTERNFTDK